MLYQRSDRSCIVHATDEAKRYANTAITKDQTNCVAPFGSSLPRFSDPSESKHDFSLDSLQNAHFVMSLPNARQ